MSDPKYGDPVEEPTTPDTTDDAVASANDSLAEAEAASRDAVGPDEQAAAEPLEGHDAPAAQTAPADDAATAGAAPADAAQKDAAPAGEAPMTDDEWNAAYESSGGAPATTTAETATAEAKTVEPTPVAAADTAEPITRPDADVATTAYTPPVTPSEPTAADAAPAAGVAAGAAGAAAYASPQPIFVQAPEPPRPRGNRAAAGAIGLLAALSFAVLYFAAALGIAFFHGDVDSASIGTWSLEAVTSWWFWVPVAVFFLGFWIFGAIVNRGRWGHWVIFGVLVGAVAYGGHLLGQLAQAPFWQLTASQGAELVREQALAPLAIAAFIFGRELTIWFGAWAAARGKRVTELNYEAQREYERTLEAGPQLHQL